MRYRVGGSLSYNDKTYVERNADKDILKYLDEGIFCYIFNSRQMGKSSLRIRTAEKLKSEGFACVSIDISQVGSEDITLDQWYCSFAHCLVDGFKIDFDLNNWWSTNSQISSVKRLNKFIESILLERIKGKIFIFIDEIDSMIRVKFSLDDFWGAIRSCYEARNNNPEYQRLNFAVMGVTTPSELIKDKKNTPFNTAVSIELDGFTLDGIQYLLKGLNHNIHNVNAFTEEILEWTGGQPFLTQKILRLIQSSNLDSLDNLSAIRNFIRGKVVNNWEIQDNPSHLKTIQDRLTRGGNTIELLRLYQNICNKGEIIYDDKSSIYRELQLSGLVVKKGEVLKIYNRTYKDVFNLQWVRKQLRIKNVIHGQYKIKNRIGSGGFGETFLVEDLDLVGHPLRTLKKLNFQSPDPEVIKKVKDLFRREAEILAKLDHYRIPSIFACFEEGDEFFIVQTYIEGVTLEKEIANLTLNKQMTEDKVIEIIIDILEVVVFIHTLKEKVIHRDIKPSNLIRRVVDQRLVLIDFGSGKLLVNNNQDQNSSTLVLGTPGYTPHEQWIGEPVDSSDIYAVGIIGIQALIDRIPSENWVPRQNNEELIWQDLDKVNASEDLKNILSKMTCFNAKDRYQSALEVLAVLKKLKAQRKKNLDGIIIQKASNNPRQTTIQNTTRKNNRVRGVVILALIFGIGIFTESITNMLQISKNMPEFMITSNNKVLISFGGIDIDIMRSRKFTNLNSKKHAFELFKKQAYMEAYQEFYQLHQENKKDPELLIYMNNAKVRYWHKLSKKPIYTIAAVVPAKLERGQQMLYGIAHAQSNAINAQSNTINVNIVSKNDIEEEPIVYLEIGIIDDENSPILANKIAGQLDEYTIDTDDDGGKRSILAVVGHYASEVMCIALPSYAKAGLPIISPTSSLSELRRKCGDKHNNVFYRTQSSTKIEAAEFIKYLDKQNLGNANIVSFYKKDRSNSGENTKEFSQDLFNAFKKDFEYKFHRKLEDGFDLSSKTDFNLGLLNMKKANVVILFPDGKVNDTSVFDRAKVALEGLKDSKATILASNPMYTLETNTGLQNWKNRLIIAVDWYGAKNNDKNCGKEPFISEVPYLWGGDLNRTTAQSYEAVQVLSAIFKDKANTRSEVLKELKTVDIPSDVFKVNKQIRFDDNGDRVGITRRILLTPAEDGKRFIPIDKDQCH